MDYVHERDNRDQPELLQMFNEAAAEPTEADRAEFDRLVHAFRRARDPGGWKRRFGSGR